MKHPRPTTVDFETYGVERRPAYPPEPVGVSIKPWGKKARYYAWAHPYGDNNCTRAEALKALKQAWNSPGGVIFQGGKFDVDVAETHLDLPRLGWQKYHDTLFLLFLDDPHAQNLGLKASAERLLDWPPEEQEAVRDWLLKRQPVPGVRITAGRGGEHYWGRYIAYAPAEIVGPYANGDCDRTEALFRLLWPKTKKRKMLEAYERERELMFILLENERAGVPVDLKRLRRDVKRYTEVLGHLEAWAFKRLKLREPINLDSGRELVAALETVGKVDLDVLGVTPKSGQPRTDKDSLRAALTDKTLGAVLRYRAQLCTCLRTFMEPWLRTAEQSGGRIFTEWNQVRSAEGRKGVGARTGRLSSSPNFQNIPNEFSAIFREDAPKDKTLPKRPRGLAFPPLPRVRSYLVPPPGYVFIGRDYSQQELRILAHYEGGKLLAVYVEDPWVDIHDHARVLISTMTNREFARKPIKNTGFGLIYGMGVGRLAESFGGTVQEAKEVKNAYLAIFPGLRDITRDMKYRAKNDLPIRTWGGREYYCEPARVVNGRIREFDYKMLNVLIQGSGADCTKQAIINYERTRPREHRFLLTVHDEFLAMVPAKELAQGQDALRAAMEAVEFDVPMLSEGFYTRKNWAELRDYDKKGVRK